ncbi:hypothetical protein NQ317_002389 [Molorchus minor]|uniref:RNase H type-1 domain-containing protein n=1 Tax=Molorchus minor TaxID=1323400 RepID=A0ABQ9ITK1_9CUCU|nr:hypothetical protein NQ317_002389 [Molorchus minor]
MEEAKMGFFRLPEIPTGIYANLGHNRIKSLAEVYAILHCAKENTTRAYVNRRISIFSDSQAALKVVTNPKATSTLVWECQKELENLGDHNTVTLLWVPGHSEIQGNEKADELAKKKESSTPFIGPEPALKKTEELLLMSRKQVGVVVSLLTGHRALKGHLHRMGLYNGDLKCRLRNRETEAAQHVLCYCKTLDCKRQDIWSTQT